MSSWSRCHPNTQAIVALVAFQAGKVVYLLGFWIGLLYHKASIICYGMQSVKWNLLVAHVVHYDAVERVWILSSTGGISNVSSIVTRRCSIVRTDRRNCVVPPPLQVVLVLVVLPELCCRMWQCHGLNEQQIF